MPHVNVTIERAGANVHFLKQCLALWSRRQTEYNNYAKMLLVSRREILPRNFIFNVSLLISINANLILSNLTYFLHCGY